MYIETHRLMIQDFAPEDAADLQEIFGDKETMANCEPVYDFEKTREFLDSFCIGRRGAVAAVHKDSGKVIGYILLKEYEPEIYEMGWIFNRNYWRQGYAYEACKAVVGYAFGELKAHKIFAEAIDAVKSVGLMRKLGMGLEGVQHSQTRDNQGNWADLYFYGLLEEDWRNHENTNQ